MGKILYIDAFSGISGDMTLGALISLGFDIGILTEELNRIGIVANPVVRNVKKSGISAIDFSLSYDEGKEVDRDYASIRKMLTDKMSSGHAKEVALEIFALLAEAEAEVHGEDIERVHFHELGAIDSIVDIVGVSLGFASLGLIKVVSGPVPVGKGFVQSRHGTLPVPAPATAILLKGIPVFNSGVDGELVTPTGAAILKAMVNDFGGIPNMIVDDIGYGAGDRNFNDRPNLLRLIVGSEAHPFLTDEVEVLTTHIDDMNPQFYDFVMERLFDAGALDVTLTPLIMKKGRSGIALTVISEPPKSHSIIDIILSDTTSSGLRIKREKRFKLDRWIEEVNTEFGTIRVKFTSDADGTLMGAYPEYDDVKKAAKSSELPILEVYRRLTVLLEKEHKIGQKIIRDWELKNGVGK